MKTREMAKKGLYVGTGMGIVLFAMVGLLPGSMIGGLVGLKLSEMLLGAVTQTMLLSRIIVAVGMVAGLMASAVTFVFGAGVLGWMAGGVIDAIKSREAIETTAHAAAVK
jgi:hypothetical protein